jgi:hypothetical protein
LAARKKRRRSQGNRHRYTFEGGPAPEGFRRQGKKGEEAKVIAMMYSRGLQFYTFFEISIGIKRRIVDIGKKITFYFLQNV